MKYIFTIIFLFISMMFVVPTNQVEAYSRVRGYYKRSGTYVQPHYRSNTNSYKWDNYSSQGNINPWNGKKGYTKWW